jgi:hypothetical protein
LLAYAGLGPGQELIPYFMALLAWVGAAFGAILFRPISSLLRRLSRLKVARQNCSPNETLTTTVPQPAENGCNTVSR